MRHYAIYDLKTGNIVQTYVEVDVGGSSKHLSDDEVLDMLAPHIDRSTVGVVPFEAKHERGMHPQVDLQTRQVSWVPRKTKGQP